MHDICVIADQLKPQNLSFGVVVVVTVFSLLSSTLILASTYRARARSTKNASFHGHVADNRNCWSIVLLCLARASFRLSRNLQLLEWKPDKIGGQVIFALSGERVLSLTVYGSVATAAWTGPSASDLLWTKMLRAQVRRSGCMQWENNEAR